MAQSLGHSLAMGPAPVPLALIGGLEEAALCTEGVCSTAAGGGFRRLQARSQHREVLLPTQGLAHSLGDLPLPDHLGEDRENTGQVTEKVSSFVHAFIKQNILCMSTMCWDLWIQSSCDRTLAVKKFMWY